MICRILLRVSVKSPDEADLIEQLLLEEAAEVTGNPSSLRLLKASREDCVDFILTCDLDTMPWATRLQDELSRRVRQRLRAVGHRTPLAIRASVFWESPSAGSVSDGRLDY
jgi:hypothetical protein